MTTRIAVDGLWRCLCPSIDTAVSSSIRRIVSRRSFSSSTCAKSAASNSPVRTWSYTPLTPQQYTPIRKPHHQHGSVREQNASLRQRLRGQFKIPVEELHDALREWRTEAEGYFAISEVVEYLIRVEKEKPSLAHYEALIYINADPVNGSVEVVANLLEEMKEFGLVPNSRIFHSALLVLAVHPDYLFRTRILDEMKDRWIPLSKEGWQNVIIGQLRERQIEMVLDNFEAMKREEIKIEPWLYDILLYNLCAVDELDEAVRILQSRVDEGEVKINPNVWYYMLDECSLKYHYEGVRYIWRKRVETKIINPSDGLCNFALDIAARNGDAAFATDVIQILSSRMTSLTTQHYESLLTAYISSSDLYTSLRILSIMKKAKLAITEYMTRSVFTHLISNPKLPMEAFEALTQIHKDGNMIPQAAINVVIEADIALGQLQQAVTHYKEMQNICQDGPNTSTFNVLFKGCSNNSGNKDLAMSLVSDMTSLNLKPDMLTYDRLILICIKHKEDYEDAFLYLDEMRTVFPFGQKFPGVNRGPRAGTWRMLIYTALEMGDSRAIALIEEMENCGHDISHYRNRMSHLFPENSHNIAH